MSFIPYNTADFAFTLDDSKFLDISTLNENTYFTLQLVIKYYNFYDAVQQTETLNYKLPLFNKKRIFSVGEIIHRNLSNIKSLNSQQLQYKTALVDITIKEFDFEDLVTVVSSEVMANIKFIAGPLPALMDGNKALLSLNANASRVTPVGYISASFLLPNGNHTFEILKNDVVVDSEIIAATATDNVFTKTVKVWFYGALPGDIFKLSIKDTLISKTFEINDNELLSNIILFVNEFKLLESLECTGDFSFPLDYDQITHKYKRNLIEVLEVIKTTKSNSLQINTGWVLETDFITIDSLLDGKKAWLLKRATVVAELVPISKKNTAIDSKRESFQYDLEFKINSTYNAQNYIF